MIPLTVLNQRWATSGSETASDENFYDVPRSAQHRKMSEVQNYQKKMSKMNRRHTVAKVSHSSKKIG